MIPKWPSAAPKHATRRSRSCWRWASNGAACCNAQDCGARHRGRPLSDSGAKARSYHAVKDANLAHVIKVDLQAEVFSFTIDEDKQRHLELLDGKLLLVTNTDAPAAEVVQRYKILADIERGFRVLKSDIEISPMHHRLPERIHADALMCFMALILYRVMRKRLKANDREESPARRLQQLPRIHQQSVRTAYGQTLHGLTEMTPAQKSLFTVLQLPIPMHAEPSRLQFVVCAFEPRFKKINNLRAASVELGQPRPL